MRAEQTAYEISKKFQDLLDNTTYQSEQITGMKQLVKQRQSPRYDSSNVRVMVNGEAGTGKSFTTNNLLGHRDLCIQAGGPKGCTNVASEYHSPRQGQELPFAAEVLLCSETQATFTLNRYISDCLAYLNYMDKTNPSDDSLSDSEEDEEHEQDLSDRYESALTALTALLCSYPEFEKRKATESYVREIESMNDPRVKELQKRLANVIQEIGAVVTLEAATVSGLRAQLRPWIIDKPDPDGPGSSLKCCPWPIVQVIKCGVASRVLQSGVALVDNPGTGDTNTSHVDKARESLQEADVIMVVGSIERVSASRTILDSLRWAFKRRGAEGVIMVCTKCDTGLTNDVGTEFNKEEQSRVQEIEKEAKAVDQKINNTYQRKVYETEIVNIRRYDEELIALKRTQRGLENERYQIRVAARNRTATQMLKDEYRKRISKGAELPVFCVSNTEYDKYLSGYDIEDPPRLSLELTGIPALRNHIQSLPLKGRFNTLDYHLNTSWDNVLKTLELFCTQSKSEQKTQIVDTCAASRKAAVEYVEKHWKRLCALELSTLRVNLIQAETSWITHGLRKLDEWEKNIPNLSHAATVRHHGQYRHKKIGNQRWNTDLLRSVETSIKPIMYQLSSDFSYKLLNDVTAQGTIQIIEELKNKLQSK